VSPNDRESISAAMGTGIRVDYVADMLEDERLEALRLAEALLVWMWSAELRPHERAVVDDVRFVQLISAGADGLPFSDVPRNAVVAGNVGAYAEPMAEHVLAMVLALAKRLPERHAQLARGQFEQFAFSRSLGGAVAGIVGFGGIGRAAAGLLRGIGMRIHALNTTGTTDEAVEFVGTLSDLDSVLEAADVLVISLPLTKATRELIGRRELELMKRDAILINVARGAIVDEAALFDHLAAHYGFSAGIDAWWDEPRSASTFRTRFPFFELPNLLGSPHNSALVPGILEEAARRAATNVSRFLRGEPVAGVMDREDYAS
jgi:phosphoglycerate dehydrogenase-like enzyme